jgi:hypothetical protein
MTVFVNIMYINLILGLLVVGAVIWLAHNFRKSKASPGEILRDEMAKRRSSQEEKKAGQERLAALRRRQLVPIADGLNNMRETMRSLPMRWLAQEERLELVLEIPGNNAPREEKFILRWDIKNLDLALLSAYERSPEFYGEYILQWPDGSRFSEAELAVFMRKLSALIADKLA